MASPVYLKTEIEKHYKAQKIHYANLPFHYHQTIYTNVVWKREGSQRINRVRVYKYKHQGCIFPRLRSGRGQGQVGTERYLQFHPEGSRIYKLVQTKDYQDKNRDYIDFYQSEVEIYSSQGHVMLSDTATRAVVFPVDSLAPATRSRKRQRDVLQEASNEASGEQQGKRT
ncbi:uncharacterized protein [Clytia hemisphaerica]|uniref:uncharacterized protein isoform X2 n=1 Tax=Clytia hemisphaerica TaxID=252671 RepID=UPI0034D6B9F9